MLGVAWSVLNPLLTCLVMWAVFGALFNQRGQGIEDFPLFLIIGQLMFNFFRESTTMAMESVLKNGPLLRKVYIPKYIFRWKSAALRSSTSFSASWRCLSSRC